MDIGAQNQNQKTQNQGLLRREWVDVIKSVYSKASQTVSNSSLTH